MTPLFLSLCCAHVIAALMTGIYGHARIAELVLKAGGDANIRSTFTGGLRMPPLSWNVYGGHSEAVQVLLEHGAHVNLDFDASSSNGGRKVVTVYDVLMDILDRGDSGDPQQEQAGENGMDRYWEVRTRQISQLVFCLFAVVKTHTFIVHFYLKKIKQVLEKYGAKRYADLVTEL